MILCQPHAKAGIGHYGAREAPQVKVRQRAVAWQEGRTRLIGKLATTGEPFLFGARLKLRGDTCLNRN